MKKFISKNTADTFKIAHKLARILKKGDAVCFYGQLGAGKTTFIKGICERFGVQKRKVTSSSFIILRNHMGKIPIYHVDLYRLNSNQVPDEVYEYMEERKGLTLIEWAERVEAPQEHFTVDIKLKNLEERLITIGSSSRSLDTRLKRL